MAKSKKEITATEQKPQKSQRVILQHTEEAGLTQLERSSLGLTLSGISAGMDIGFSVLLMTVILTLFNNILPAPFVSFMVANMYPVGFLFVVLGRSELFTEHTALAILPVLQGLSSVKRLLRLWVIVYLSNIFGGIIFAMILSYLSGSLQFLQAWALKEIIDHFLHYSLLTTLLTATLAGWLMGLLAWLVAASRETISQIAVIWIVTAAIGLAGLPHCIVGNIEVSANLFLGNITFYQYLSFLGPVTLGNAIGGVLFVGILKYSHTAYSGEEKEVDLEKD